MALMAFLLPVLIGGLISAREGRPQQQNRERAAQEIRTSTEALRSIREASWNNISINGSYHVAHDGIAWRLEPSSITVEGMTTQIVISDVVRDGNNTIVPSGGAIDPSTKHIVVTVSWLTPSPASTSSTLYLTRYLDNATYIQTTEADFNSGSHTNTIVINESDGEVTLGVGGGGNWCSPQLTIAALNLPKNGEANALTAIEGKAFTGTGNNASGVSYAQIAISNASPPVATVQSTIDGYKTNDIFGDTSYGYITTDTNSSEVVIINLSTSTAVGTFNASGSTNGDSIFVLGNVGYMTQGSTFRTFDLSSKTGSRSQLGAISLSGSGKAIMIVGNYAYVALTGDSTRELVVISVANPSSLSIVAYANVSGINGEDVFVNETGTRAYLATRSSGSQPEVFIINTSSPSGSLPVISSYDTNGMDPQGVTVVPGNKIIVGGISGEEYQVINISSESTPTRCGGIEVDAGINDVASILESDGDAYSYILTRNTSSEFQIIAGGPGGQYSSSGTYDSETFDVGYSTAFNRFIPTHTSPANTTTRYQVAVADPVSGSCSGATYTFVGPDATAGSFYTTQALIPFDNDNVGYENPARCFRYRAYLSTTDSSSTPFVEEVTVNYSP